MANVSTYLNFPRNTQQAFDFYKSVFEKEFYGDIMRFKDMPAGDGMPPVAEADKDLIIHIALPIHAGHFLMGTDAPESMGFKLQTGNNVHINLGIDTRAETEKLFKALSAGGTVSMELQDMFWGDYFGSFTDKFGINWMLNCPEKA